MSSSLALIRNENMKIYRRPRTWVMFLILVSVLILMTVLLKVNSGPSEPIDWRQQASQSIQNTKQNLADMSGDMPYIQNMKDSIKINEYALEHNINPYEKTLWSTMNTLAGMIGLVTLLTIIVAADMIAAEFTWGTIKLLLIRPATRTKILVNKYITTLLFSLVLLIVMFIVSFILGAVTEGFSGINQVQLNVGNDGLVHERTMLVSVLQTYGFQIISLIMYVTLAFAISSAFRSSTMAIAFSLGLMLVGTTVVGLFSHYSWIKYVLFANIDLNQYFGGYPVRPDMTLGFSIAILVAYFILFHFISWVLFIKRDVAT